MKILYDLLQFLVSGAWIILCVLGNNNKNVIETSKHLESLIKSTLKTLQWLILVNIQSISLILANIFILILLGYFKS